MVASWWHYGGVVVALWWRHGGVMVALAYAPKPEFIYLFIYFVTPAVSAVIFLASI